MARDVDFEEEYYPEPIEDWNTNEYNDLAENSWQSVKSAPLSTFGADVDTAAYSQIRSGIMNGYGVDPGQVRIEEMINYFSDSERDVLLFMVGDHGPSFLSNIEVDTREPIDIRKKQVPYFIWSNNDVDYRLDLPENHDIDLCSLTPCAMVAAGLPLSPYYLQLYEIADTAISISGVNYTKEDGSVSSGYVLKDGILKDVYEDTPESNLVRDYFYMEYNSLQGKPRMDALFDAVQKEAN